MGPSWANNKNKKDKKYGHRGHVMYRASAEAWCHTQASGSDKPTDSEMEPNPDQAAGSVWHAQTSSLQAFLDMGHVTKSCSTLLSRYCKTMRSMHNKRKIPNCLTFACLRAIRMMPPSKQVGQLFNSQNGCLGRCSFTEMPRAHTCAGKPLYV